MKLDVDTLRYVASYHAKLARDEFQIANGGYGYHQQQRDYWRFRAKLLKKSRGKK